MKSQATNPAGKRPRVSMADEQYKNIIAKLSELKLSVDNTNDKLQSMEDRITTNTARNDKIEKNVFEYRLKSDAQSKRIEFLESRVEKLESKGNELNLLFCGIPEGNREQHCEEIVKNILQQLQIPCDNRIFQSVYRIGRFNKSKTRPIMARYQHIKDRNITWSKRRNISTECQYIRTVYTEATQRKRRILQAVNNCAEENPRYKGMAKITLNNQIWIGKERYEKTELHKLPHDLKKAVGTASQDDITAFFGMDCPLSNLYMSPFTVGNQKFTSNEQYYYFCKARHYRNYQALVDIIASDNPVNVKRIGKPIGGDDDDWNTSAQAQEAMHQGLLAKFNQNQYLAEVLLSTGEYALVEANLHDSLWGIGLELGDPKVFSRQ